MLWVKALHIIFVVSWFAGLLYLPRLFVYHAQCTDELGHERFIVMERKLFAIMTIAAALAWVFGLWLLFGYALTAYGSTWWLWGKLASALGLTIYHFYCKHVLITFREGRNQHSHRYFRWMNEVPAFILAVVVILVVVKPL